MYKEIFNMVLRKDFQKQLIKIGCAYFNINSDDLISLVWYDIEKVYYHDEWLLSPFEKVVHGQVIVECTFDILEYNPIQNNYCPQEIEKNFFLDFSFVIADEIAMKLELFNGNILELAYS